MQDQLPSIDQIASLPESAILAALDAALFVAMQAMLAANPELDWAFDNPDDPFYEPERPRLHAAETVCMLASATSEAIATYLHAVGAPQHKPIPAPAGLPF